MIWFFGSGKGVFRVNPNKTGGGGGHNGPPLTFRMITLQRAKLSPRHTMTIFFWVSHTFWHQICDAPGLPFRSHVYFCTCMHVGPKKAQKCDFVYKINANWAFSLSSYKYTYFYSQWLKLICFSIIVLQKVSATNFTYPIHKPNGILNRRRWEKNIMHYINLSHTHKPYDKP